MDGGRERIRLAFEVELDVLDSGALTAAAEAAVSRTEFGGGDGRTPEQERQDELDLVRQSPAQAVLWCVDELSLIDDVPGVEATGSSAQADDLPLPDTGRPDLAAPAFADLFRRDPADDGSLLTPRSATALWSMLVTLADQAYDDVEARGDDPVDGRGHWHVFDRYPRITRRQDAVWRRQCARSFDDLADDLAHGREPQPRCRAEETALHLALRTLPDALTDQWWGPGLFDRLPAHDDDLDEALLDGLFQDHDVLALYAADKDGIEDPDDPVNAATGMGDMRPAAWFRPFDTAEPRDGRRPFRR